MLKKLILTLSDECGVCKPHIDGESLCSVFHFWGYETRCNYKEMEVLEIPGGIKIVDYFTQEILLQLKQQGIGIRMEESGGPALFH